MERTDIINALIQKNNYTTYLEIGVQRKVNWGDVAIDCKHGVDPDPAAGATYTMTSDDFFDKKDQLLPGSKPFKYDIIFVDGLHEFKQVYRDILNSLDCLSDGGTIVVHDCSPQSEAYCYPEWNGNVWLAILKLRIMSSDLNICIHTVDVDHGCAVITRGEQDPYCVDDVNDSKITTYKYLNDNRENILNLISSEEFIERYID